MVLAYCRYSPTLPPSIRSSSLGTYQAIICIYNMFWRGNSGTETKRRQHNRRRWSVAIAAFRQQDLYLGQAARRSVV